MIIFMYPRNFFILLYPISFHIKLNQFVFLNLIGYSANRISKLIDTTTYLEIIIKPILHQLTNLFKHM